MLQKIRRYINDIWEEQGPEGETNLVKIYKKEQKKKRQKTAYLDKNITDNGDCKSY
jgi:hypothetical protein